MGFQLAVMKQESAFDARAKAPRGERKWFGLVKGDRLSSAYGYAQALDTTWETYKRETGNGGADRHNFRDAADFIGWYFASTGARTGPGSSSQHQRTIEAIAISAQSVAAKTSLTVSSMKNAAVKIAARNGDQAGGGICRTYWGVPSSGAVMRASRLPVALPGR